MAPVKTINRSVLVDTARRLAIDEGLSSLTMGRIAEVLGVTAPALYRHIDSRGRVLEAVADAVAASIERPSSAGHWRRRLHQQIDSLRTTALREPAAFGFLIARNHPSRHTGAIREAILRCLIDSGVPLDTVVSLEHVITSVVAGYLVAAPNSWVRSDRRLDADREFAMVHRAVDLLIDDQRAPTP